MIATAGDAPDTRSGLRAKKPARASLVLERLLQPTGCHAVRFLKLSFTAVRFPNSSYSPSLGIQAQTQRAYSTPRDVPVDGPSTEAARNESVVIRRRVLCHETQSRRPEIQQNPCELIFLFSSHPQRREYHTPPTRYRTQRNSRHHANAAPSRPAAAGREGSPLVKRSSPGSLKHG